jgi:hypothetical protein
LPPDCSSYNFNPQPAHPADQSSALVSVRRRSNRRSGQQIEAAHEPVEYRHDGDIDRSCE